MYLAVSFIVSLGAIQGLILSAILGITKKYKFTTIRFFALLLLAISSINIYGAFDVVKLSNEPLFEDYVPYVWSNVIPPAVYFFIKYLVQPNYQFKKTDYLFFLPVAVDSIYQFSHFFNFLKNGAYSIADYNSFDFIGNLFEAFASIFSLIVFTISLQEIIKHQKYIKDNFSNIEKANLLWAKKFLIIGLSISICWMIVTVTSIIFGVFLKPLAILVWISITILIYWTAYSMLFEKYITMLETPSLKELKVTALPEEKKISSQLDIGNISQSIKHQLNLHKPFLNPDLTLRDLALATKTTDKKLSVYLNQHLKTSFYDFINQQRIEEFKHRINQGDMQNFSVVGLALECGFKSKSSFYRAFKKHIGTTPTEYLKQVQSNFS